MPLVCLQVCLRTNAHKRAERRLQPMFAQLTHLVVRRALARLGRALRLMSHALPVYKTGGQYRLLQGNQTSASIGGGNGCAPVCSVCKYIRAWV